MTGSFDDAVISIRALVARERFIEEPYQRCNYKDIESIVIFMNDCFSDRPYKERRVLRLYALSYILGYQVESTYDLTRYQSRVIRGHIAESSTGKDFIRYCASKFKSKALRSKRSVGTNGDVNREIANMSNM